MYLLVLGDHLPDPATGVRASPAERITAIVEQAVLAERAGFAGVAIGEHHFSDYFVAAPDLLLAHLAARTATLRLSTGVTLLAHHDPVRVAEQLATLDLLSAGRAELIVARGVAPETDAAFGITEEHLRPRFEEHLRLLVRLLTESDVRWRGRYRAPLDGVTLNPRPVQRPHPPLWIGSASDVSATLGAELGLPLMLPSTLRDPASFVPVVARYRDRGGSRVGLPSHVHVATDAAQARRRWRPYLTAYAEFAEPWRGDGQPLDVDRLMAGPAVCGDPIEVADRLNALTELLSLDRHLVLLDVGGLPPELVAETIALFGAEVLPKLRG